MTNQTLKTKPLRTRILKTLQGKVSSPKAGAHSIALMTGAGEEELTIVVRKNSRSRNMVIRYQPLQHHISLTLPRHVSIAQGLRFVEEKRKWLEAQLHGTSKPVTLTEGNIIPVLGKHYTIVHGGGRGLVRVEEACIIVPGEIEFLSRRLREWLKAETRKEIMAIAEAKSAELGKPFRKIALRDTSSRWGSCNHLGHLSFSWRLVFAPYDVMAYVVCHEIAHLKHMDHSPAFWQTVGQLCPGHIAARRWLKASGAVLYAYN